MIRIPLSIDAAEALRVIFTHEKIPFTVGVGVGGTVFDVDMSEERVRDVLSQWAVALHKISRSLP